MIGNIDVADEVFCDSCLNQLPPWQWGVVALSYLETRWALFLALKHRYWHNLLRRAAKWMAQANAVVLDPAGSAVLDQVALLSAALARRLRVPHCADLLVHQTRTRLIEGCTKDKHFVILKAVICRNPRHADRWVGWSVLVFVAVMTFGAMLTAATKALHNDENYDVYATVLARSDKRL